MVDFFAIALMFFGYWRGRKRGLGFQVYKFVMMLIPLALGCGLFKLAGKVIELLPFFDAENAGFTGFLGITGLSFILMLKIRGALRSALEKKFGTEESSHKAGIAGLLRYALYAVGIIAGIELSPAEFLTSGSHIAGAVRVLLETPRVS